MVQIKPAKIDDIKAVQAIEKEYYEGFACPEETLRGWIEQLPENFFIAEDDGRIVAFLFFEYLDKIKAIPFVHKLEHLKDGKYVYISEVGVLDKWIDSDALQTLYDSMKRKATSDGCEGIVWLTGSKSKHDQVEKRILAGNSFSKQSKVKNWECYPKYFVSDHYLWYIGIQGRT